jgi:Tol biopolymer transport system component
MIDPAGGTERRLTRETVDVIDFALAPDGGRVAYTRQDGLARTSIWTVNVSTGATVRLSPDETASFSEPAWSPDGDLIVFERRQALTNAIANPKLVAARADGAPGGLIYGRGDEVGFGARWSPDGARLAFFDPIRLAVIIFNFTPDRVTIPVQTTVAFDWSPDGRHLVIEDIVADGGAFQHVLLLADSATAATTRLTRASGLDEAAPAWSPDGRSIAFTQRPTAGTVGGAQAMLLDYATGQRRPLARETAAEVETTAIAWSPDGATLLLNRLSLNDPSAETTLWLNDLATGESRRLGVGEAAAWLS